MLDALARSKFSPIIQIVDRFSVLLSCYLAKMPSNLLSELKLSATLVMAAILLMLLRGDCHIFVKCRRVDLILLLFSSIFFSILINIAIGIDHTRAIVGMVLSGYLGYWIGRIGSGI